MTFQIRNKRWHWH